MGPRSDKTKKSTSGDWDYFGGTYNSAVLPAGGGALTVTVFDVGNSTLASGTVNTAS